MRSTSDHGDGHLRPGAPLFGPILFVSADVPWPPDGGGRIASLRVLEAFTRIADVDLIALADPFRPLDLGHLESICRRVEIVPHPFTFGLHPRRQALVALRSAFSLEPYRLRKFQSRLLAERVGALRAANRYALVHHEQLGAARYRDPRLPSTALVQNVESEIYRLGAAGGSPAARLWAAQEGPKLRRSEPRLLRPFDHVFVLSRDDADCLRAMGVDTPTVLPMPAPPLHAPRPPTDDHTVLSLGSMSWFGVADGLRWFHDTAWKRIIAQVPDATWHLVGPGAPPSVRKWGDEPSIQIHGYIADLDEVLGATRVAVVPLQVAGGIRMKLLDLMAAGIPSVATTIGAQGLTFADGDGAVRRDDPASFADAVVELLTNDAVWTRTANAGRRYLVDHHAPEALVSAVAAGVSTAIERHAVTTNTPRTVRPGRRGRAR